MSSSVNILQPLFFIFREFLAIAPSPRRIQISIPTFATERLGLVDQVVDSFRQHFDFLVVWPAEEHVRLRGVFRLFSGQFQSIVTAGNLLVNFAQVLLYHPLEVVLHLSQRIASFQTQ